MLNQKLSRQLLCLILAMVMVIGMLPVTALAATHPFTDIEEDEWYADAVQYVYDNQLMNGISETEFDPDGTTTRAMVVTVLYRMEGEPEATENPFADIQEGAWYANGVMWAAENGIVTGYPDGNFGPDDPITREQMATIFYRYVDYKGYDVSDRTDLSVYIDSDKISAYAVEAMNWAVAVGLIRGVGDSLLSSESDSTRAQIATILMRFEEDVEPDLPVEPVETTIPEDAVYYVTFVTNGGSAIDPVMVERGDVVAQPEDPVREGYRLLAWYVDEELDIVYDFDTPVTSDITLYAAWEQIVEEESVLDRDDPDIEIYSFDVDTRSIVVNEEVEVTFTAEIFANVILTSGEVGLYCDDALVGSMNDEGIDGDAAAYDGIFTYVATLSSDAVAYREYHVSVRDVNSEKLGIGFYELLTDEQLDAIGQVDARLNALMTDAAFAELTTAEQAEQIMALLTAMVEEGLVQADSVFYEEADRMMCFIYACGTYGAVYLEEETEEANGFDVDQLKAETEGGKFSGGDDTSVAAYESTLLASSAAEVDVLIFNGFENTSYRRNFYNELETEWDAQGLNTTIDLDVTVTELKNLGSLNYDVFVFAMHGSKYRLTAGANKVPVLSINEAVNATNDRAYSYELNNRHSVIKVQLIDGSYRYWITPKFFEDNLTSISMDGSMIFSETCMFYGCDCQTTTPDYAMANVFTNASAEAVIGYHNSVGADYSRLVMKDVIAASFDGSTIAQAVTAARNTHGQTDNWTDASDDKYEAYPIIAGNGGFILRPDGMVAGTIKNASSGAAISGALIRAYDNDGNVVTTVRTDGSGAYVLYLDSGEYTLYITAGSYQTEQVAIVVEPNRTTYCETFLLMSVTEEQGTANGSITNSITGELVPGVSIKVRKNWNNKKGEVIYSTTANANGYYEINGLKVGFYTIEYYKSGFTKGYKNIFVMIGGQTQDLVISPVTSAGVFRVVLTWGENPSDLDSHMVGYTSDYGYFHVYYGNKSRYDGSMELCNLDIDDVTSYGPETVTLNPTTNEPYYYYVYHYSGSGSISTSGAQVRLYEGEKLIRTYNAPEDQGTSRYWNVFAIVNGEIVERNTIKSSPETSYTQAQYGPLELTQRSNVSEDKFTNVSKYSEFLNEADKHMLIPGLKEGMIPQGISYSESTGLLYVSAYYKEEGSEAKNPSVVMVLDQSGEYVAEYHLYKSNNAPMTGHVGGIAVTEDTLYVAWSKNSDGEEQIAAIPLATLTTSGSQSVKLTTSYVVPVAPSFMSYNDGYLWLGNFYYPEDPDYGLCPRMGSEAKDNDGKRVKGYGGYILGYNLMNGSVNFDSPDYILATPKKIQGMVYNPATNTVVLSQSYGRHADAALLYYDLTLGEPTDGTAKLDGETVSCYILDDNREPGKLLTIPMTEGLALDSNDRVLVVFESGSNFYCKEDDKCEYPTDYIWRTNPV